MRAVVAAMLVGLLAGAVGGYMMGRNAGGIEVEYLPYCASCADAATKLALCRREIQECPTAGSVR
jgi:hypothetical protein